ncbi:MAG: hypothetical protein OXT07_14820, partial [bacterium]|nr:hypothetical protein [bacterium]
MTLSVQRASVGDGGSSFVDVLVTVTAPASSASRVRYLLCFGGSATLDRGMPQRAAGEDYQVILADGSFNGQWGANGDDSCAASSGSVSTIAPNTSEVWRIRVLGDAVLESEETIIVELRESTDHPLLALPSDVTLPSVGNPFTLTVDDSPFNDCVAPVSDGSFAVPADWPLAPEGLEPWSLFRLLFVTAGEYAPPGGVVDVSVLDEVVRAEAVAGHSALGAGCAGLFSLLGSTLDTSARENTSTRASDTGASV